MLLFQVKSALLLRSSRWSARSIWLTRQLPSLQFIAREEVASTPAFRPIHVAKSGTRLADLPDASRAAARPKYIPTMGLALNTLTKPQK